MSKCFACCYASCIYPMHHFAHSQKISNIFLFIPKSIRAIFSREKNAFSLSTLNIFPFFVIVFHFKIRCFFIIFLFRLVISSCYNQLSPSPKIDCNILFERVNFGWHYHNVSCYFLNSTNYTAVWNPTQSKVFSLF